MATPENNWLDRDEVRHCLNEVANVLAKFRCGIVNKEGRTILVKIEGPGRLKAIAHIEEVSPLNMEYGLAHP